MNENYNAMVRRAIETKLSRLVNTGTLVIGGGFHGATFAVNYGLRIGVLNVGPPGGIFGTTLEPAYYLNSRTRPGDLGRPGEAGTLNAMPGGRVQPSDFSWAEYPSQDVIAKCVLTNLGQVTWRQAEDYKGRVLSITDNLGYYRAVISNVYGYTAKRIVIATGLGDDRPNWPLPDVVSSSQFWRMVFAANSLRNVAVVGGGDSGKVVVEALLGMGPKPPPYYVEHIDWFGLPGYLGSKYEWEDCTRSRYKGIGRHLDRDNDRYYRINLHPKVSRYVRRGNRTEIQAGSQMYGPYDLIIECKGFRNSVYQMVAPLRRPLLPFEVDGEVVGRKVEGEEVYVVGPAAKLPISPSEAQYLAGIGENVDAIFRYAPKTAALARYLTERS